MVGAGAVAVMLVATGGGGAAAAQRLAPSAPIVEHVADGRFTVRLSALAVQRADAAGVRLPNVVRSALERIATLLPGPRLTLAVAYVRPGQVLRTVGILAGLIPGAGTTGTINAATGVVAVGFGPTSHVRLATSTRLWLPRVIADEVANAVRGVTRRGLGVVLLDSLVGGGIEAAFDTAAFPGPPDPWVVALTPAQQCTWWRRAVPELADPGLSEQWMFGYVGVPHWAGFTLGYHLVGAYRLRHPREGWRALTMARGPAVLAGSHFDPCPA